MSSLDTGGSLSPVPAGGWGGEAADGQGRGGGRDAESALKPKVTRESARKRKM